MTAEPFQLTMPKAKTRIKTRRGGWAWGPVDTVKLRFLSFGGGIQSTALVWMMIDGVLPWVDHILYAETGDDGQVTGDHVDDMEREIRKASNQVEFHRVSKGEKLSDNLRRRATTIIGTDRRFIGVPFFTGKSGQGRRQCTREFKIEPLEKKQRELLGYKPRQVMPKGMCEVWIGISTDEVVRAGAAFARWSINRYPLLEQRMSRSDCARYMADTGRRVPPKSACVYCPYRSNQEWRNLRDTDPQGFADAIAIDEMIRDNPNLRHQEFVHPSRKPLAQVDLSSSEERGQGMLSFCDGGCGL